MNVYDVILTNEDGRDVLYDVAAPSELAAIVEAWRQYRELPYVDGDLPAPWTKPRVGAALDREDGEKPYLKGFDYVPARIDHLRRFKAYE